ncbi:caprin-1b isoform X4 [Dunckerocampus dactyliophorus]|uniref:caprin-1b isoform X4 n=1 Tax=Dunckerocampus dactyliophorus TaxID=161453 RepID=UPI002404E135|nr:caprin-1b isoform X4 [Dunckerocampus dactyliophorus]
MPSAMNANGTVQAASPDAGSSPGLMGYNALGGQSEVLKQVLLVIDKKARNMEKKKSKLDDYQVRKDKGERLNQDQLEALSKYQEVMNNLEFARELQKTFITLGQDIQKVVKKSARREQLQREEAEQRRLKTILELQFLLDRLGDESVRQDLKQGVGGSALLTEVDLMAFDDFYKLVGPDRDQNIRLADQYEEASVHLWDLLEGRDKAVVGTTYKALKERLDQLLLSGYFDQVPTRQNGVCEEQLEEGTLEEEEVEVQVPAVEATATESSEAEEQAVDTETEVIEEYVEPIAVETKEFVNRQFIPDGTYSGSEKEQGDEWTTETEVPIVSPTPSPMFQTSHSPDSRPTVPINPIQTSMSLPSEHPPPSTSLPPASQTQVFQPVPKTPHSSGINVNAAPFQSMQTVFNLNAPVPPAETDALNQPSQYQNSFNQAFGSQTQHPVEPTEIQSEQLQPAVGAFHSQDQSGGHQQPSQQGPGFGRQTQSFYNSRGMSRSGARNARGMINGYRGSSNGFRGAYDGYRPPFANTPNSGYGQTQFNSPRDYSNGSYQRDGYQQNYKRGVGQGPRGASRGSTQAMRS